MSDFALGETVDASRDRTRRITADKIAPLASQIDRAPVFPRDLWPATSTFGLHGIAAEDEYGGLSWGARSNLSINQIRRFLVGRELVGGR